MRVTGVGIALVGPPAVLRDWQVPAAKIAAHRPELEDIELPATPSHSALAEEHRRTQRKPHGEPN